MDLEPALITPMVCVNSVKSTSDEVKLTLIINASAMTLSVAKAKLAKCSNLQNFTKVSSSFSSSSHIHLARTT